MNLPSLSITSILHLHSARYSIPREIPIDNTIYTGATYLYFMNIFLRSVNNKNDRVLNDMETQVAHDKP